MFFRIYLLLLCNISCFKFINFIIMSSTQPVGEADQAIFRRFKGQQQNEQFTFRRLLNNDENSVSCRFKINSKTVSTASGQSNRTVTLAKKTAILAPTFVLTRPLMFLVMLLAMSLTSHGQVVHKTAEQLHMSHPTLKVNRASSKFITTDVDKMIQNQLSLQQQQQFQVNQKVASGGKSQQQQRQAKANDYEKLKRDALIDTFKVKLLKLLDIEEAPNAAEVNIKKEQIPEPIMREYERLMKQSEKPPKRVSNGGAQLGRKSRDMLNPYSKDVDMDEETLSNELEEDQVRFNGSMVQQLTLLPKKCKHFLRYSTPESY
jgi:hypothetical protein